MILRVLPIISTLCFSSHVNTSCTYNHNSQLRYNGNCHKLYESNKDDSYINEYKQKKQHQDSVRKRRRKNLGHWGVELTSHNRDLPVFPFTFDAVADDAFDAIRGTLLGLQRPDPNTVSNAMHRSVLDYRPTQPRYASSRSFDDDHSFECDDRKVEVKNIARMGIEIDGAAYLFSSDDVKLQNRSTDEGAALRILSLKIAGRLAGLQGNKLSTPQSIAVYYSSLEQTLLASNDLRRLKQTSDSAFSSLLDKIQILCIGQHSLPENIQRQKGKDEEALTNIVLIVKPTDYTGKGLYPTIYKDIINKLQSLLFQAVASSVPAVVISPRLSELPPLQQYSTNYNYKTGPSGFEQSGFQQSATYGGNEPAVGPTAWLLRDLIPPVYVWVGCSLDLLNRVNIPGKNRMSRPSIDSLVASYCNQQGLDRNSIDEFIDNHDNIEYTFYSRVALMQSTMNVGHMYHLFAVKETAEMPLHSGRNKIHNVAWNSSHIFMGSMKSSLGRPTIRVMNDVFEEWNEARSG